MIDKRRLEIRRRSLQAALDKQSVQTTPIRNAPTPFRPIVSPGTITSAKGTPLEIRLPLVAFLKDRDYDPKLIHKAQFAHGNTEQIVLSDVYEIEEALKKLQHFCNDHGLRLGPSGDVDLRMLLELRNQYLAARLQTPDSPESSLGLRACLLRYIEASMKQAMTILQSRPLPIQDAASPEKFCEAESADSPDVRTNNNDSPRADYEVLSAESPVSKFAMPSPSEVSLLETPQKGYTPLDLLKIKELKLIRIKELSVRLACLETPLRLQAQKLLATEGMSTKHQKFRNTLETVSESETVSIELSRTTPSVSGKRRSCSGPESETESSASKRHRGSNALCDVSSMTVMRNSASEMLSNTSTGPASEASSLLSVLSLPGLSTSVPRSLNDCDTAEEQTRRRLSEATYKPQSPEAPKSPGASSEQPSAERMPSQRRSRGQQSRDQQKKGQDDSMIMDDTKKPPKGPKVKVRKVKNVGAASLLGVKAATGGRRYQSRVAINAKAARSREVRAIREGARLLQEEGLSPVKMRNKTKRERRMDRYNKANLEKAQGFEDDAECTLASQGPDSTVGDEKDGGLDSREARTELQAMFRDDMEWETLLKKVMGDQDAKFRIGQREAIERIMSGSNSTWLVSLPTGAGKSLIFQLAALYLSLKRNQLSIFIAPTLPLLDDQANKFPRLAKAGRVSANADGFNAIASIAVRVGTLCSGKTSKEYRQTMSEIAKGQLDVVFMTPEQFVSFRFLNLMKSPQAKPLGLLCMDEAHCLTEWGHSFRPAYQRVMLTSKRLGCPRTLLLTATLSRSTLLSLQNVVQGLQVFKPFPRIQRPDLEPQPILVESLGGGEDSAGAVSGTALQKLLAILKNEERLSRGVGTIIVYVWMKWQAEQIAFSIKRAFPDDLTLFYHSGIDEQERATVLKAFTTGSCRFIIATQALGIGIDSPHVCKVIHFSITSGLEQYLQEIGRCKRSALPEYSDASSQCAESTAATQSTAAIQSTAPTQSTVATELSSGGDSCATTQSSQPTDCTPPCASTDFDGQEAKRNGSIKTSIAPPVTIPQASKVGGREAVECPVFVAKIDFLQRYQQLASSQVDEAAVSAAITRLVNAACLKAARTSRRRRVESVGMDVVDLSEDSPQSLSTKASWKNSACCILKASDASFPASRTSESQSAPTTPSSSASTDRPSAEHCPTDRTSTDLSSTGPPSIDPSPSKCTSDCEQLSVSFISLDFSELGKMMNMRSNDEVQVLWALMQTYSEANTAVDLTTTSQDIIALKTLWDRFQEQWKGFMMLKSNNTGTRLALEGAGPEAVIGAVRRTVDDGTGEETGEGKASGDSDGVLSVDGLPHSECGDGRSGEEGRATHQMKFRTERIKFFTTQSTGVEIRCFGSTFDEMIQTYEGPSSETGTSEGFAAWEATALGILRWADAIGKKTASGVLRIMWSDVLSYNCGREGNSFNAGLFLDIDALEQILQDIGQKLRFSVNPIPGKRCWIRLVHPNDELSTAKQRQSWKKQIDQLTKHSIQCLERNNRIHLNRLIAGYSSFLIGSKDPSKMREFVDQYFEWPSSYEDGPTDLLWSKIPQWSDWYGADLSKIVNSAFAKPLSGIELSECKFQIEKTMAALANRENVVATPMAIARVLAGKAALNGLGKGTTGWNVYSSHRFGLILQICKSVFNEVSAP